MSEIFKILLIGSAIGLVIGVLASDVIDWNVCRHTSGGECRFMLMPAAFR